MVTAVLTPAAGKRLIAKALVRHPVIQSALNSGTVVIVAGTTNGYVAEEILSYVGQLDGFQRKYFFRGIVLPPTSKDTREREQLDKKETLQDVIICQGKWLKGKTVYDVIDSLKPGDVILKGANAFDPLGKRAAILIGHPEGGTILVALRAVIGRRVHLIIPVGLEKRVFDNLDMLAAKMNASGNIGPRLFPVVGEIFTEIEALLSLRGCQVKWWLQEVSMELRVPSGYALKVAPSKKNLLKRYLIQYVVSYPLPCRFQKTITVWLFFAV